jgi:hypothetical protein
VALAALRGEGIKGKRGRRRRGALAVVLARALKSVRYADDIRHSAPRGHAARGEPRSGDAIP